MFTWAPRVEKQMNGSVDGEAERFAAVFVPGVDLHLPRSDNTRGRRRHLLINTLVN